MLKNYLKIAVRNLVHQKVFSVINILGLAVGLVCCLAIVLHIQDELSYDTHHKKAKRIYRVTRPENANTAAAIGPALLQEYSAVENAVRFQFPYPSSVLISNGEKRFYEEGFLWADSTVFDVFTYALLKGNPKTALTQPNSLVLTQEMAEKYFGTEDPVGKVMTVDGWTKDDYKVTGVLANLPQNSHIAFDFLGSILGADRRYTFLYSGEGAWTNNLGYTYLLLHDDELAEGLAAQLPDFAERHLGEFARSRGYTPDFRLQPLTDIHLHSQLRTERGANSDIRYIYLFSAIAVLILLIACINYMNLATARSTNRAREVGMRKVLGANRLALVRQFLGESVLMSFAALLLAFMLIELVLPILNNLSGKSLALNYFGNAEVVLGLIGVTFVVGILAGAYPAFFLSAFRPLATLKGKLKSGRAGFFFRKGLITVQFVTSIVLIVATMVVFEQLHFVRNQSLGFDKERIAIIPIRKNIASSSDQSEKYELFKQELLRHPDVLRVSAAAGVPGNSMLADNFPIRPAGSSTEAQNKMRIIGADHDFLSTLGIELIAGRNFSRQLTTDAEQAFIVNESAAKTLGWDDPVGRRIELVEGNGKTGTIIGVVKDFHFESLHQSIQPAVIHIWPDRYSCFAVKLGGENLSGTIDFVKGKWTTFAPGQPFEFSFLDEDFDKKYREAEKIGSVFGYASALAILIACMGLFGLAAYSAEQRTKEIGIRKILGGSVAGIINLLVRDIVKLVVLAGIIACPIAWYAMTDWLQDFAYRIDIGWWLYAVAGGLALMIALVTVSTQAIRAALANPIESLRYE